MVHDIRVGLVLGGGGVVGGAFHAGALAALENDWGWDARSASVIVGTSAGALVGALLASGVASSDLAAFCTGAAPSSAARDVLGSVRMPDLPAFSFRELLRPRIPNVGFVRHWLRSPWSVPPHVAALTLMGRGTRELSEQLAFLRDAPRDRHRDVPRDQERQLWLTAVRRQDGERVVFGSDDGPAGSLAQAVAASCSIPGYFAPVEVDEVEYIDGGVRSATNADLLTTAGLDLAVVVAPLAAQAASLPWDAMGLVRQVATAGLRREVRHLEQHEIPTIVIVPSKASIAAMGDDLMRGAGLGDVVREAFLDAGTGLGLVPHAIAARLCTPGSRGVLLAA
jgi:NTE family protein